MVAPLYNSAEIPVKKPEQAHSGLWFDRFFNRYNTAWDLEDTAKAEWIKSMAGTVGQLEQLESFIKRQYRLVKHLQGSSQRYKTDWHFVTGMGNSHPVENGFSWHATLGVPYIAGSAVKGLVRAWVELNDDNLSEPDKKARLKSWFGTEDKTVIAEQTGDFIFFDAIPEQSPNLIADIMTPHMGKWYSDGGENRALKSEALPADWHEPIPVTFLAVKHAQFIFSIAPRKAQQAEQLPAVFAALEQALEWLGAGAKTAAGYGYMAREGDFSGGMDAVLDEESMSQQQLEIAALTNAFQQNKTNKIKEAVGGRLYTHLNTLIKKAKDDATEPVWSEQDKKALRTLGAELLTFVGAKNPKIIEVLGGLPQED